MLQKTPPTTNNTPPATPWPSWGGLSSVLVDGQSIAKRHSREPWERAVLGARWYRGELIVKPTVLLAGETFDVCSALVRREIQKLEAVPARPLQEVVWAAMPAGDRHRFVSKHFDELFEIADTLTSNDN